MYFSSNGAYRKSKMVIDILNIILTAIIIILFIIVVFWGSMRAKLFPVLFIIGALTNALTATKSFLNSNKASGIFLTAITVLLLIMAAFSWGIASRTIA